MGVVSDTPIARVLFDDNADAADPVCISHVAIATRAAHIMEGVPAANQSLFWAVFHVFVGAMLVADVLIMRGHRVSVRAALRWSVVWVGLSVAFAVVLMGVRGPTAGVLWLTSYLLEKFLSVDNLFVFVRIFTVFQTPPPLQHKALQWGIFGAIVFRALFIFAGIELAARYTCIDICMCVSVLFSNPSF